MLLVDERPYGKKQYQAETMRQVPLPVSGENALWTLDIGELTGKNIEVSGREEVNKLLSEGWILLHMYTLIYREEGVWRERPMVILGLPRSKMHENE